MHQRSKIDPTYLYQEIFPQLSYVSGEIFKSTTIPEDEWYTGGQISGTCTQRSLHQMLKSRFPSIDEYRRFIYGFKMYAITQYLRQESVLNAPEQHDLIEQAIKHNLRLLNLEKSEPSGGSLFTEAEKDAGHTILVGFLSKLKPVNQSAVQTVGIACSKTKDPELLHNLLNKQSSSEDLLNKKSSFDDFFCEILKNSIADSFTLARIALKAKESGTLDALKFVMERRREGPNLDDHICLEQMIQNKNISANLLPVLLDWITNDRKNFQKMAEKTLQVAFKFEGVDGANTPGENLYTAINNLRLKALEFLRAAKTKQLKYEPAAKAAFSLYILLNHATTDFVNKKIELPELTRIVQASINQYKPVLGIHRGMKGFFQNIINSVIHGVNRVFGTTLANRMFKTQTIKIAEDTEQNIPKPPQSNQ